jgi:hypothetical protein
LLALAANDAAIIDGPHYSFSIRAPEGWRMTSTRQLQAAFYPSDKTFEKTPIIMYVRSADKAQLHVNTIDDLDKLDLLGIHEHHPTAESKKIGSTRTSGGKEIELRHIFCHELATSFTPRIEEIDHCLRATFAFLYCSEGYVQTLLTREAS